MFEDGQSASKAGRAFFCDSSRSFLSGSNASPEAVADQFFEQWPHDRRPRDAKQLIDIGRMLIERGGQMVAHIVATGEPVHITLSWAACVSLARQGRLAAHAADGPCKACTQAFPTLSTALAVKSRGRPKKAASKGEKQTLPCDTRT